MHTFPEAPPSSGLMGSGDARLPAPQRHLEAARPQLGAWLRSGRTQVLILEICLKDRWSVTPSLPAFISAPLSPGQPFSDLLPSLPTCSAHPPPRGFWLFPGSFGKVNPVPGTNSSTVNLTGTPLPQQPLPPQGHPESTETGILS